MRIIGEVLRIPAIIVHHVDFTVPLPLRLEGDTFTVRRP